jgi:hypothetical protein
MEPADLAEAREKAEAAELAALEAEHTLHKWHMDRLAYEEPTEEKAQLVVRASLLRSLAMDAFMDYRDAVGASRGEAPRELWER